MAFIAPTSDYNTNNGWFGPHETHESLYQFLSDGATPPWTIDTVGIGIQASAGFESSLTVGFAALAYALTTITVHAHVALNEMDASRPLLLGITLSIDGADVRTLTVAGDVNGYVNQLIYGTFPAGAIPRVRLYVDDRAYTNIETCEVHELRLEIASATITAADMVNRIKTALRDNPGAVKVVNVDGQEVQYDRAQAMAELKEWERRALKEAGGRPRTSRIRLDGSF